MLAVGLVAFVRHERRFAFTFSEATCGSTASMSLPGTMKLAHMNENVLAGGIQRTPEKLTEINRAVAGITVQGERMPQPMLDMIDAS